MPPEYLYKTNTGHILIGEVYPSGFDSWKFRLREQGTGRYFMFSPKFEAQNLAKQGLVDFANLVGMEAVINAG